VGERQLPELVDDESRNERPATQGRGAGRLHCQGSTTEPDDERHGQRAEQHRGVRHVERRGHQEGRAEDETEPDLGDGGLARNGAGCHGSSEAGAHPSPERLDGFLTEDARLIARS
jgi:hypothetical protein